MSFTFRLPINYLILAAIPAVTTVSCAPSTPTDRNRVEVQCEAGATGIGCSVRHVAGQDTVNVLWDVEAQCKNGTVVTASGDQVVEIGQTVGRNISEDQIKNVDKCDECVSFSVKNIRIETPN